MIDKEFNALKDKPNRKKLAEKAVTPIQP